MTSGTSVRRPTAAVLLAVLLSIGLAACGGGSDSGGGAGNGAEAAAPAKAGDAKAGDAKAVKIALFRYQPDALQVPAGTTVTWTNDDAILHTVTSGAPGQPSGVFDEEMADKGATASVTFDKPGTFAYFCARHPEAMRGTVTVTG